VKRIYSLSTCAVIAIGAAALQEAAAQTRELSTDRPDRTESPYTVPQGKIQLEMDVANWTHNEDAGVEVDTLAIAPFNLKYGIGADTDIQFVVTPYVRSEVSGLGLDDSVSGIGDVTVRLKQNIWGNDDGSTAFAIMPFVTFPTADDDFGGSGDVEGGVILPLGFSIADGVGAGVMLQVNALKDSSDDYAAEFIVSGTVGFDITDQIGGYVELFASKFDDIGEKTQATFDFGVTYSPEAELQFDAGANLGLNSNTDDMQMFVGVSRRW
jgi:hypothetical protein